MLVRDAGDSWQIVLQTEHGELAGQFARALVSASRAVRILWRSSRAGMTTAGSCGSAARASTRMDARRTTPRRPGASLHLAFYQAAIVAVTEEDRVRRA